MKAKPPHHVVLEKDFAGIPQGSKLHISSPAEVAAELQTISPGYTLSMQAFRRAAAHLCAVLCQALGLGVEGPRQGHMR